MTYIYPECPSCGSKAGSDNGVTLQSILWQPFVWYCDDCGHRCVGNYQHQFPEVQWVSNREPTLRDRIVDRIMRSF